jgi:hypothetical protein
MVSWHVSKRHGKQPHGKQGCQSDEESWDYRLLHSERPAPPRRTSDARHTARWLPALASPSVRRNPNIVFIIPKFDVAAGAIWQQLKTIDKRGTEAVRQWRVVDAASRGDPPVGDLISCADLKSRGAERQLNPFGVHLARQQPSDAAAETGKRVCAPNPIFLIAHFAVPPVDQHCGAGIAR